MTRSWASIPALIFVLCCVEANAADKKTPPKPGSFRVYEVQRDMENLAMDPLTRFYARHAVDDNGAVTNRVDTALLRFMDQVELSIAGRQAIPADEPATAGTPGRAPGLIEPQ